MAKSEKISTIPPPKHPPTSATRSELRQAVREVIAARDGRTGNMNVLKDKKK